MALAGDGTHSIVASDTDVSSLTGSSTAMVYTLATQPPTVSATESVSGLTKPDHGHDLGDGVRRECRRRQHHRDRDLQRDKRSRGRDSE